MIADAMKCMVLPESVSFEQGSMSVVNPLTALSFIHMAKHNKTKAVVFTAAASQLGQMFLRLCMANGITLIGIVRKDEHV